jgi:Na+-driven multidrug efflux pump
MPIIGSVMMPLFSIINTGVVGYLGDPNLLAGYGLGSLALGIFVVSTTV